MSSAASWIACDLIVREHPQRLERILEVAVGQRSIRRRRQPIRRRPGVGGHGGPRAHRSHSFDTANLIPGLYGGVPRPKRSISQERNSATAASLSASGCVIR